MPRHWIPSYNNNQDKDQRYNKRKMQVARSINKLIMCIIDVQY